MEWLQKETSEIGIAYSMFLSSALLMCLMCHLLYCQRLLKWWDLSDWMVVVLPSACQQHVLLNCSVFIGDWTHIISAFELYYVNQDIWLKWAKCFYECLASESDRMKYSENNVCIHLYYKYTFICISVLCSSPFLLLSSPAVLEKWH